ncbi:MAG: cation:proton antiporter [Alphaproteobacteria bacterium]
MQEPGLGFPFVTLLVGIMIVLVMVVKPGLKRLRVPSLVGFMALGFLLRLADDEWGLLSEQEHALAVFEFLANLGIVVLLFRVGLESNLPGLIRQLPWASQVWIGNVVVSGLAGFAAAYFVLHLGLIPSLFVATALTATSVSVPVSVWQEVGALRSRNGEMLLDVAGLDDISAITLMALLLALAPAAMAGAQAGPTPGVGETVAWLLLKLAALAGVWVLFARYVERPLTAFFAKIEPAPDLMLLVVGTAIIMASGIVALGFSLPIGAFIAGLAFSRDPEAIKVDEWLSPIHDLFAPFFFIGIGLAVSMGALTGAAGLGAILLTAAVLGKLAGTSLPALPRAGAAGSVLLGISMIPRAEIALVVMHHGMLLGDQAVPPNLFNAMVMVSVATCLGASLVLYPLLRRWPQAEDRGP